MNYGGIDIGKKRCVACVTDENGQAQRELAYRNTRTGITELAEILAGYGECIAVLESTGNLWLKTYEVLESKGIPVKLANPSRPEPSPRPASRRINSQPGSSLTCCELT